MRITKIILLIVVCLMVSGCQQSRIEDLENESTNQNQEVLELTNKVFELNKMVEKVKKENDELIQIVSDYEQSKHPIEIEFENEMKSWSGNNDEGVYIVLGYGDQWKEEMNKYYNLLLEKLNEDKRKWLVSSQEQWELFTKENEELAWHVNDQIYHDGSIMRIFDANIYYYRYRDRALYLKEKYEILSCDY
ncbi:hypothetical protein QUF55_05595 [Clostridiaceae bacterium HSG29]|nr:hypothetical protein [Clostridiaceae bacterium HSG29]